MSITNFTIGNNNKPPWYKSFWGVIFLITLFLIMALGIAFGLAVWNYKKQIEAGNVPAEFAGNSEEESLAPNANSKLFPGRDNNPSIGPDNAKVEVIIFEDFECLYCGQFFQEKKELINDYQDRVLFVFKNFPMESIHPHAISAAQAGECAYEQDRFWEMHDKMYLNQENLEAEDILSYAISIGLDEQQFGECMAEEKYMFEVEKDLKNGRLNTVTGTPTFFINGEKFEGAPADDSLRQVLDFYLGEE